MTTTVRERGRQLWCVRCEVKIAGRACPSCGVTVPVEDLTVPAARRAALKADGWVRASRGPGHTESWTHPTRGHGPVTFASAWRLYRSG